MSVSGQPDDGDDKATDKDPRRSAPFRNILAVCDLGADHGGIARQAKTLAQHLGGRAAILFVSEHSSEFAQIARHSEADERDVIGWFEGIAQAEADSLAESVGIPANSVAVRIGKPFLEIIREVQSGGYDLVMKAADRVEGVAGFLFASTDQHLIRKCPCPVWLSTPPVDGAADPGGPVMAAIDTDENAASEPETLSVLNAAIIDVAACVAHERGVPLIVATVWDAPGEGLARRWFAEEHDVFRYVRSIERERSNALQTVLEQSRRRDPEGIGRMRLRPLVEQGAPRTKIPELAERHGVSLLVMGTIARSGLSGFLIGNTAEDVLNTVTCSVIAVKPEGFVSPVH